MADPDPMEPDNWLIPANSTTEKPPAASDTHWPYWDGEKWFLWEEGLAEREQYIRKLRDEALAGSDWTQLPDSPLKKEERDAWKAYRKTLRDLTKNPAWPFVDLPTNPAENGYF
jgi:hypothetical protein